MMNTKTFIPLSKLFAIWMLAGLAMVVSGVGYVRIARLPAAFVTDSEIINLMQGSIFLLAAFWAATLNDLTIGATMFDFSVEIKKDLKLTLKYFMMYALSAAALIGLLYLTVMLMMKLGLFSMAAFNNYYEQSMTAKVAQKNYLGEVLLRSPVKLAVYLFSVCVLIPIEEEIFMRRLLYVSLRAKMTFLPALLVSSLIFGLTHLGAAAVSAFVAGLFLGWIYERHHNLPVNIMVHGSINLFVSITMLFFAIN